MSIQLIPSPKELVSHVGTFELPMDLTIKIEGISTSEVLLPTLQLLDELEGVLHRRPVLARTSLAPDITLSCGKAGQNYQLSIAGDGIHIHAEGPAGCYYGIQTLLQLIRLHGASLPYLSVVDRPDFARRGFYHDVTRGKVPKLSTLFELVEKMAHYKLNELQLYIEHTFAYAAHPDIWEGSDPLSAEDIIRLDEHCARHHVDLVPSFSTFGHFYTVLRSYRKQHLNELDLAAADLPFGWFDRMAHYTLNPQLQESIDLVHEIIAEVAPLFRSSFFNICCDETFDLGKGHSKALLQAQGGKVYSDFLMKIMQGVQAQGKRPMFWGDIILKNPELIAHLPKDAIPLNWDYGPNPEKKGSTEKFAQSGLDFYICPGVCGWNRWNADSQVAYQNITRFALEGKKHGAMGFLNTDWGDYGHINLLGQSLWGMILGADQSWCAHQDVQTFNATLEALEFPGLTGIFDLVRRTCETSVVTWRVLSWWTDASQDVDKWPRTDKTLAQDAFFDVEPDKILEATRNLNSLRREFLGFGKASTPSAQQWLRELALGLEGEYLTHATVHLVQVSENRTTSVSDVCHAVIADDWRRFEKQLSEAWHLRNQPSEYHHIRRVLIEVARRLDKMVQLKT